ICGAWRTRPDPGFCSLFVVCCAPFSLVPSGRLITMDFMQTPPMLVSDSFPVLVFLLLLHVLTPAGAAHWPAWRGPHGDGQCDEKNLPLRWSTNENVRWRIPLPDRGNSTPVVWGSRVFVTQAVARESRRMLMCFDRATGALLWQEGTKYEGK